MLSAILIIPVLAFVLLSQHDLWDLIPVTSSVELYSEGSSY